jgi:hypothetical protein
MIGLKVFVYYNLRKKCWSVRHKNKVIAHANSVALDDVEFKVSEKGRQRVLKTKHKNVHAGVVGILRALDFHVPGPFPMAKPRPIKVKEVSYNPYKHRFFYDVFTNKLVKAHFENAWLCQKRVFVEKTS